MNNNNSPGDETNREIEDVPNTDNSATNNQPPYG